MANEIRFGTLTVVFEFGKIWNFSDLPSKSIALDGAVQGPVIDPANKKYSFDHHGGCCRMVTLATCQQVATALELGLNPTGYTVYCNDWDADTILALWLLLNPNKFARNRRAINEVVQQIGLRDSHGPAFEAHPIHSLLGPAWGDRTAQEVQHCEKYLNIIDRWFEGEKFEPIEEEKSQGGFAYKPLYGWLKVAAGRGFSDLYKEGYMAAALKMQESSIWVIAKKSDLVKLPLGPADSSQDRSGNFTNTILGHLAKMECEKFGIPPQNTWGGGSSVGGSPRVVGIPGSRLTDDEILSVLSMFVEKLTARSNRGSSVVRIHRAVLVQFRTLIEKEIYSHDMFS